MLHFIKHFRTITRHRHKVIAHCAKAGILWQGLRHDLSKYSDRRQFVIAKSDCVDDIGGRSFKWGAYGTDIDVYKRQALCPLSRWHIRKRRKRHGQSGSMQTSISRWSRPATAVRHRSGRGRNSCSPARRATTRGLCRRKRGTPRHPAR